MRHHCNGRRLIFAAAAVAFIFCTHTKSLAAEADTRQVSTDLLIVGGTESGWAAAITAARMGVRSITLVNDIDWLGGQFTAEAVCAIDEDRGVGNKVPFARSGLFKELTERLEAFNLEKYGHRQPGNAWTAHATYRPAEGEAIFRAMLQPYIDSKQVTLISNYIPVAVELDAGGTTVRRVRFAAAEGHAGPPLHVAARITIDASDWGEVIQLSGAGFEYGPDLRSKYNEPSAPKDRRGFPITDMNPLTWCMVIEERGGDQVIERPPHYDDRSYWLTTNVTEPDYQTLGWPHRAHRPFNPPWMAHTGKFYAGERTVYSQRRLIDHYNLNIPGGDVILLCWTIQDYPLDTLPAHVIESLEADDRGASKKNIVVMTRRQRRIVFDDARHHSLGMLHHLQTTVHERMTERAHSFRRFALSDEFGTADRLPPKPYIRESLRLEAMYMMREQDTRNAHKGSKRNAKEAFAKVMYHDGVACWQFTYDFHPTGRMFLPGDGGGPAGPWQSYIKPNRSWGTLSDRSLFALRSMVPREIDGLIGSQKNLGYSSIVSSAFRIHPHGVAAGQAAGTTAAVCLANNVQPRAIPYDRRLLENVRDGLCGGAAGEPLMLWPFADLSSDDASFVAVNRLAVRGGLPMSRSDVSFRADDPADDAWRAAVVEKSLETKAAGARTPAPKGSMTRGQFAISWWSVIENLPDAPFVRASTEDADNDGINDVDDALPFDARNQSWDAED